MTCKGIGECRAITLTAGIDNFVGTAGNDTFNAPITDGGTLTQTLTGLDSIDGGAGVDTLNVDFGANAAALPGSATIKNIEIINASTTVASAGFDVSAVSGVQEVNLLQAGAGAAAAASAISNAGTATKASITGGTTASISGKAITEVTVTKASDNVTIDNLNATTGVTSTGTTLTSVTLDGVVKKTDAAAHAFKGDAINTVTLKNIVGAGTNKQASTITNAVSKDLTVNVDNVGYELSGVASTGVTSVTAGAKAENITVNATGAKSAVTVTAAAAKNLTITGSADLTLAGISGAALKFIDGSAATGGLTLGTLNAGTADVKTGSGNDSFEIKATKVTVDAGAGDDTVTLGSTLAIGSTVNLGAGNDVLLSASGAVSAATTAGTVTIDGGDGIDTVAASLINATNAKQFLNFERIDASAGSTNLDVELMTGSTIGGITLNGGNGTVTLQNVAAGAGLTVAGSNTGSLTVGVKGAATNKADVFDITFAGKAGATATAGTPDGVVATDITLAGVETVNVNSSGTGFVANKLVLGGNTALTGITITGDKALDLSFSAANGSVSAPLTGVASIDGSAMTGALKVALTNVVGAAAGVAVKGGAGADEFITIAGQSATLTGGAGNDNFVVTATVTGDTTVAASKMVTITDFAAGDKITGLTAAGDIAKITLTSVVQNLDDAFALLGDNTGANDVQWFNYGSDTYVVFNDASAGLSAADVVVKLTGTIDLSNATVTAGVLELA